MSQIKQKLSTIWQRMAENIDNDFLDFFIVTSRAAGLEASAGRSAGMGKSTMATWMNYRAWTYYEGRLDFIEETDEKGQKIWRIKDYSTPEERLRTFERVVREYTVWTLNDLIVKLLNADGLIPAIVFDDVQYDCPAWSHIPPDIRKKIEWLSRTRQRVANIILTAPAISEIAKPMRGMINWEIIIPTRGIYEIQFIGKRRDFYNPTDDRSRLWYEGSGTFDRLPDQIDLLYKKLRDQALEADILAEFKDKIAK